MAYAYISFGVITRNGAVEEVLGVPIVAHDLLLLSLSLALSTKICEYKIEEKGKNGARREGAGEKGYEGGKER
jgi:hypothetical protein